MVTALQKRSPQLSQVATDWACQFVWFDDVTQVTDRPWAQTWRLKAGGEQFYLKSLPAQQTLAIDAMPLLHEQFPDVVPRVVANDHAQGLILFADHGGRTPRRGMDESINVQLLETYARVQAQAAKNHRLLEALPTVDLDSLLADFFQYLNPETSPTDSTCVGADFYLGRSKAKSFYQQLSQYQRQLAELVKYCDELPPTINHCDLRRSNMALSEDGRCQIYDWDEAVAAPAGLSLHNFFGGCFQVMKILANAGRALDQDVSRRSIKRMNAYVGRLVRHEYSGTATLRRALPATACVGVIRYLQSYSAFPKQEAKYRQLVKGILRDGLSDLVELCEWIESGSASISDVEKSTVDSTTASNVAERSETAEDSSGMQVTLKRDRPRRSDDDEIRELEREAELPESIPTLRFSKEEIATQKLTRAKRKLGVRLFQRYGVLLIENAFDADLVDKLTDEYFEKYSRYSQHERHADALKVGSRRYMVTIEMSGAFNSPAVYAPPFVFPVIRNILGEKMILGSTTAVASLGGSKDMHIHKDHPALFSRRELEHELPSFGVSMILPLLGFSEELGTTRVWKGSHQTSLKQSLKTPHQDPYGSKGACLLMDYRLTHQGLANRTDRVRPLLDIIYQRPWFRDIANYGQQEALVMSDANYDSIPEEHRSLFDWSRK